jgi:DNA-binding transcriptional ArsR family regulator
MTGGPPETDNDELPSESVKRAAALRALRADPMTRAELVTALDVSRTTIHRTVQSLDERGLLVKEDGKLALSVLGATVADEVETVVELETACDGFKYDAFETAFADYETADALMVRELLLVLDAAMDAIEDAAEHLLSMQSVTH